MRIAIDAMGGDLGPRAVVWGAAEALRLHPQLDVTLFGPRERLEAEVSRLPRRWRGVTTRLALSHAETTISQATRVSQALRAGRGSSLALMLDALAAGRADAGVSAGNTGALMALSRRALGMVAGIPRPAITTAIPTREGGRCYMIDMGANIEATAERLVDFARMADIMVRHVDGLARPRIALLNVGVEATKGPASVREADARLRTLGLNYVGFVEGDGLFNGAADVVVCDGFVGNIVLKSSEGLARMLVDRFQTTFSAHWGSRLVSLLARPALLRVKRQLDPVRYNGASLLGLAGIVVKSHGHADAQGFAFAVSRAVQEVRMNLPARLSSELGETAIPSVAGDPGDSGFATRSRPDDFNSQRWMP
ncbi:MULTISPECIES: phosphate acyltransferase PlsX [unclassified Modicisalibacter]|uniref:phosphate acyltransferase PlsX n=1 Tax=unclassified Modicisalibacter TaxID=2679913 RepID=UPI001CCC788A|nr:phosphate acyltransferase PlsX [Modicisalibacter sp. R2A 31.J]MBZ9574974.1 phosphate acyltransferase PlsX [Modicisalibacter sp. MOD 31.J]